MYALSLFVIVCVLSYLYWRPNHRMYRDGCIVEIVNPVGHTENICGSDKIILDDNTCDI